MKTVHYILKNLEESDQVDVSEFEVTLDELIIKYESSSDRESDNKTHIQSDEAADFLDDCLNTFRNTVIDYSKQVKNLLFLTEMKQTLLY